MALAPADFYAYSNATGSPYPETPEERARLAPQVLEFRRNQLKSTQQPQSEGANPLAVGIGIGLGLLGLGGAGFAARKMLRSGKTQGQSGAKQADLSQINVSELKRASQAPIQQEIVAPSKLVTDLPPAKKPQTIAPVQEAIDLETLANDAVDKFLTEYEQLAQSQARADQRVRAGLREREMQIRGAGERVLAELRQESLVEKQKANAILNTDQALNAVESGEDQMTGRMKQQLQRNENLDLSQIEVLEDIADQQRTWMMEQDEPINQVASQLPSGAPIDQAEDALGFAQNQMRKIRATQAEKGYYGLRAERQLLEGAQGTQIKQAAELYAATGDPNVLSLISSAPSLPLTVKPQGQQAVISKPLKGELSAEVPTSSLYTPFAKREPNVSTQEDVDIRMTNRISALGDALQNTPKTILNPEYVALEEQTNMAMFAMQQGDPTAANVFNKNRQLFRSGNVPPKEIVNPDYLQLTQQIQEAESVRSEARNIIGKQLSEVSEFPYLYKVSNLQEGMRPTYKQTSEGEVIPESLEIRTGLPSVPAGVVEKPASGSSLRGMGGAVEFESFIPEERELARTAAAEMAMGPKVGMEPQRREAMLSRPVRWDPTLHTPAQRTPEGFVYTEEALRRPSAVASKSFSTRPPSPPEVAQRSVDVSETIRRLQSSNAPGAQEQLRSYMQSLRKGMI